MRMLKSTLLLAISIGSAAGLAAMAACGSGEVKSDFGDPDVALPEREEASVRVDGAPVVHDDFKAPVLADGAQRYASRLFNPAFLRSKNLPVPEWLEAGSPLAVPTPLR